MEGDYDEAGLCSWLLLGLPRSWLLLAPPCSPSVLLGAFGSSWPPGSLPPQRPASQATAGYGCRRIIETAPCGAAGAEPLKPCAPISSGSSREARKEPEERLGGPGYLKTAGEGSPCLFLIYLSLVFLAFLLVRPWPPWNSLMGSSFLRR
jgi:hypothetical protein